MRICGLQKVTLLDFPQNIACTVFLGGCNLDCPFCYNSSLIKTDSKCIMSLDEFFNFLKSRVNILDGVAITGGEPLIHCDIESFILKIRDLGFKIKLDTNGTFPNQLRDLISKGLIDYVAMDIKNSYDKYELTVGKKIDIELIKESISILMNSGIDYEFRTTVVNEFHNVEDFKEIGKMIKGAKKYFLQNYQYQDSVRQKDLSSKSKEELIECLTVVKEYVSTASLREID